MSYLWTTEQIRAQYSSPYALPFRYMGFYASYATTGEFVRSVLPPCLEPAPEPTLTVSFMAMMDWRTGVPSVLQRDRAALLGINAVHDGREGSYFLTVIEEEEINIEKGREFWGMPKKQGKVDFFDDGRQVYAHVERKSHMLVDFLGSLGEVDQVDPEAVETSYYYELKAGISATALEVYRPQLIVAEVDARVGRSQSLTSAEVTLHDSPYDPGVATIDVGAFREGAVYAGEDVYRITETVELEGDGNDYAPYVLGRLYHA